jgi:hypothetical protein
MSFKNFLTTFFLSASMLLCIKSNAQQVNNWTKEQLMAPADLSKSIQENKQLPVILSVGPMALIPHSTDLGAASETENLKKLKKVLSNFPKDTSIVIYCGCCPFDRCPNVRPAIEMLKAMNFNNYHLLNLPVSIKADWIDKGYPVVD